MPPQARQSIQTIKDFFIYTIFFESVDDTDTPTGNINIQADSDFRVEKLTQHSIITSAMVNPISSNEVIPNASVLITDTGSGRQIMDGAVPMISLFGNGRVPFILGTPKIFPARATITVQLTSFELQGLTYDIRLIFIGTKIFKIRR